MKGKYILALDQGTTSSRAVLFDSGSNIVSIKSKPLTQIYPRPGWVEHDPVEIWKTQLEVMQTAVEAVGISSSEIECIGITNQRETVIVWERSTGKPVCNAIVWQCRRTSHFCDELKKKGLQEVIRNRTGLLADAYFSGTKIKWVLENIPGAKEKAYAGELLAGTVDTWLIWNLTGGNAFVTDYSNASRTMLFNIHTLDWDSELLDIMGIPACMLPRVVRSSGHCGTILPEYLGCEIPVCGMAGDQQSALFGQACYDKGSAKNTYGTGCFILMNTGEKPVESKNNLITTIAWDIGKGAVYALEGSVFNAGSSIQWLRDELCIVESARQCDIDAEKVADTGGVYVVPAFTGLGAPYWDMYARGAIVGITRGTKREHIIRATLEAIAYQSRDVIEAMQNDSGIELKELKVDGGASVSPFLMQFQADILGVEVKRPKVVETTALGAAYLAGLGTGFWRSIDDIKDRWASDRTFRPEMSALTRSEKYSGWKRAVERSMGWESSQE